MGRYWRPIALSAVGWLTLAAGPQPSDKDQAEKQQSRPQPPNGVAPVAVTISGPVKVVQPEVHASPCGPNQYQAKDDLCAQWKAADAASEAATWAMIGTIVAAIGTFGLYWQIRLTRRAVEDTGEATQAMRETNRIAAESHRPWLQIEVRDVTMQALLFGDAVKVIVYPDIAINNTGARPAINIRRSMKLAPVKEFSEAARSQFYSDHNEGIGAPVQLITPNGQRPLGLVESCDIAPDVFEKVQAFCLALSVIYGDGVTGAKRQTAQTFLLGGSLAATGDLVTDLQPRELMNATPSSPEKLGRTCAILPLPGGIMT
jgi:hypothetical protein